MAFMEKNFSVLAYANGFTLWDYITEDSCDVVSERNYFNKHSEHIRIGDMILVNSKSSFDYPKAFILLAIVNENGIIETEDITTKNTDV